MNIYLKSDLIMILAFFYRTMIASVPLLRCASTLSGGELRAYFERHIDEEIGHDAMQLNDMRALGVVEVPFAHFAAQFAGSQYYLIQHEHPALLLGYMRALESRTMTPEEVEKLEKHHGVTLTCLRHHVLHDPDHKLELDRMIAAQPPELQDRVQWNEHNTHEMLMNARL